MKEFCQDFKIRHYELGNDLCLRIETAGNFMEEVAGQHSDLWGAGIDDLSYHGISWAMSKMRIVIHRLPKLSEKTRMITWPVAQGRQGFRRDFSLRDEENNILLSAVSWWVVFDLKSRKMTQIPDHLVLPIGDRPEELDGNIKIHAIRDTGENKILEGPEFIVRYSDIDKNQHVNNVRYLTFAYESALPFINKGQKLKQIDLSFRAESYLGDKICSKLVKDSLEESSFTHSLYNEKKELLRARSFWE